mmetsp:Transcript_8544/g.20281  ORF Transcript_8544/g.20281 Transcript_8544/m.20281 type:complete len:242 (+) Transcript_8544:533-1258(+)
MACVTAPTSNKANGTVSRSQQIRATPQIVHMALNAVSGLRINGWRQDVSSISLVLTRIFSALSTEWQRSTSRVTPSTSGWQLDHCSCTFNVKAFCSGFFSLGSCNPKTNFAQRMGGVSSLPSRAIKKAPAMVMNSAGILPMRLLYLRAPCSSSSKSPDAAVNTSVGPASVAGCPTTAVRTGFDALRGILVGFSKGFALHLSKDVQEKDCAQPLLLSPAGFHGTCAVSCTSASYSSTSVALS